MSLSPKNWDSFQHYKGRRPPWIKLHRGLLDDYAFSRLPVASRALAPLLWLLASEYDRGEITASIEEIAFRLRMTEGELSIALKPLVDAGFFVSASEMLAPRKQYHPPEIEEEKEIEQEKNIRAVAVATRPAIDEDFEKFWKVYPKRDGSNPRAPARKAFLAALKAGTEASAILAGAGEYARRERERIGTPYIAQAVTWLRQRRWEDYAAGPPPQEKTGDAAFGWRPGMPTSEELRAKHRREIADGETAGTGSDESPSLESGGLGVRPGEPGMVRGEARNGGIQGLGGILRKAGLDARNLSPSQHRSAGAMDGPVSVASVVHR